MATPKRSDDENSRRQMQRFELRTALPDQSAKRPIRLYATGTGKKIVFRYKLLSSPVVLDTPPEVFLWYYSEAGLNYGWHLAVPSWSINFCLTDYHETTPRSRLINEDSVPSSEESSRE